MKIQTKASLQIFLSIKLKFLIPLKLLLTLPYQLQLIALQTQLQYRLN